MYYGQIPFRMSERSFLLTVSIHFSQTDLLFDFERDKAPELAPLEDTFKARMNRGVSRTPDPVWWLVRAVRQLHTGHFTSGDSQSVDSGTCSLMGLPYRSTFGKNTSSWKKNKLKKNCIHIDLRFRT